jgi:hypothetical protein
MLPTFIHSAPEFQSAVQLGITSESLVLEFKETVNDWSPLAADPQRQERRKEAQKEMCRDIAQFANTLGGCLLIGVTERPEPKHGVKVADSIAPVKEAEQLRQWIEHAVVNYVVPSTFSHDLVAITLPEGIVLSINVPANRHLVCLWDRANHTIEYLRRTSHGKEWMNPDEAERHLMDGSRAAKLAIITAKEQAKPDRVEITGGLWWRRTNLDTSAERWNPNGPITFGEIREYWFELKVPTKRSLRPVTIPYELVEAAWVGASGAVTLMLKVRMIRQDQDDSITLEPYV